MVITVTSHKADSEFEPAAGRSTQAFYLQSFCAYACVSSGSALRFLPRNAQIRLTVFSKLSTGVNVFLVLKVMQLITLLVIYLLGITVQMLRCTVIG